MEGGGRKHPAAPAQTEPLRAAHARQSGPGCRTRSPGSTRIRVRWMWGSLSPLLVGEDGKARGPGQKEHPRAGVA